MNPQIALNLAMILFLPWFAILGVLFWVYPRAPRPPGRRLFDASALVLAVSAGVLSTWWSVDNADPDAGAIWKQVLASTLSYGAFLAVLTTAFLLRRRWFAAAATPEFPR